MTETYLECNELRLRNRVSWLLIYLWVSKQRNVWYKEEKGGAQDAAERIKAATLSAAKGLSRSQAERAAAAAARNVNAYGQKEEGPSRWQERKEAKRQMYLMSTEKQVRLGERKDQKASMSTATNCQKCFQPGHWTYECKNELGLHFPTLAHTAA
ncbi:putative transcription factor interactor and regulator CCHC(Zn) family [Helianthus annuus]|nr:putative transcription factor interactor and regulator CCHC(Zn) family [Helianthus annuus]